MSSTKTAKTKGKHFHYAYLIVLSCFIITAVPCAMVLSCAGIFFTPVSSYLNVPLSDFTLYFSILNIAMMVGSAIGGPLLEKFNVSAVLTICTIICGVGMILMSFFNALWEFYLIGIVLGVAVAPLVYLAVPTLVNNWCKKNVGFFMGLGMVGTGAGAVLFNPIGTALINMSPEGWRMGYLVFGIVILVVTLPFTIFVVKGKPSDKGLEPYGADEVSANPETQEVITGVPAKRAMRSLAFFAVALFCGLVTLNQTVYQFIPSYCTSFTDSIPTLAALSGVAAACCMAGQAIGKVILGIINDHNTVAGMATGLGLGCIGILLMWFFPSAIAMVMIGAFLFGFAYACTTVQSMMLTREAFGSLDYTVIYSRITIVGALCGAFASWLLGVIVEQPNGFSHMFILSLILMVICFLLGLVTLRSGKKLPRVTAEEASAQSK